LLWRSDKVERFSGTVVPRKWSDYLSTVFRKFQDKN